MRGQEDKLKSTLQDPDLALYQVVMTITNTKFFSKTPMEEKHLLVVAKHMNDEGIFARYNPQDKSLVGFTIINFSKKFGREPREVEIPLHA